MTSQRPPLNDAMTVPESTFTGSRPWCPHPERWHALDVLAAEDEVSALVAALVIALRPNLVIETGSYLGHTAHRIGLALADADHDGHLITVEEDPYLADQARLRCEGLPVTVVTGSSLDHTPPGPADLLWLDSADTIRGQEIVHYYPWFHEGTIVAIHDVGPQHQVRDTLRPLIGEVIDPPLWLRTPRGVALANVIVGRS